MVFDSEQRKKDDLRSIDIIIDMLRDVYLRHPLVQWITAKNSIKSATTFAILTHEAVRTWTYQKVCPTDYEHVPKCTETLLTYGQGAHIKEVI